MHYARKKLEMTARCNGHYLMGVEGNQKKLHEGLQAIAQQHKPATALVRGHWPIPEPATLAKGGCPRRR